MRSDVWYASALLSVPLRLVYLPRLIWFLLRNLITSDAPTSLARLASTPTLQRYHCDPFPAPVHATGMQTLVRTPRTPPFNDPYLSTPTHDDKCPPHAEITSPCLIRRFCSVSTSIPHAKTPGGASGAPAVV